MEGGEGMVAVVRGLRDAGLAVTLLDGNRQYSLMPNNVTNTATSTSPVSGPLYNRVPQRTQQTQHTQHQQNYNVNMSTDSCNKNECGAQAIDGRYASTYRTMHCNQCPTSPPQQLSEFPPQRSQVNRGHGNFQVGGTGSGDMSHRSSQQNGSFRGAMCWPDRGSVCIPRPSREMDAFANSLRKYPNLSPDRSTEIVERLISYTQNKNAAKYFQARSQHSPTRISDSYSSYQNLDRSSRNSTRSHRNYEPEVRVRPRTEEAPTRDIRCRPSESPNRLIFEKSFDIRYIRDNMSKRVREVKGNTLYPNQSTSYRERFDNTSSAYKKPQRPNLVNMEIQAGVKMVSREAATVPTIESPKRTVAASQSLLQSAANRTPEGAVSQIIDKQTPPESTNLYKTVQKTLYPVNQPIRSRKSVQTTLSFTDLNSRWRCNKTLRKSRSQEELRVDVNEDIINLLKNVVLNVNNNNKVASREETMFKDYDFNTYMGERFKFQIGRCDKERPEYCHFHQCTHFNDVNDRPKKRMRTNNSIFVYRAEITPFQVLTINDGLESIVNDWINMIEMQPRNFSGRPVDRKAIFHLVTNRLRFFINSRPKFDVLNNLKSEIIDIVKDVPIEIRECSNKWVNRKNKVIDILFNKVKSILIDDLSNERTEIKFSNNLSNQELYSPQPFSKFRKHIQPTDEELKEFIAIELVELMEKLHSKIDFDSWDAIEVELTDILIESIEAILQNNDSEVKNKIITVLIETGGLSEYRSIYFANILIEHLKDIFSENDKEKIKNNYVSQTFVVMPGLNYSRLNQSNNNETADFSIEAITDSDIQANFNAYTNQIIQHIDDWLIKLALPGIDDKSRQVVVKDLAGDIVDRQKYLELNPGSRGSSNDELNYLKYQIFKYINQSGCINPALAIQNTPELIQRIQNVPVPLLTRPNGGIASPQINSRARKMNTSLPICCPTGPGGRTIDPSRIRTGNRRLSSPAAIAIGALPYRPMQIINEAADYPPGQRVGYSAVPGAQTFKQTNDEYEQFINDWVQEIPIPATTPQEKDFADKMRKGIFNGVWKSLAKVRANPDKYYDTFHIEDVLDDDIEELLDMLPQSQELESKKFDLKTKFLTTTTGTTRKLKLLLNPSWYKEELIDKFLRVWPRRVVTKTDDEDPVKLFEELQALKLVEGFILYIRYRNDDKVKSNVYKNKLLKNVKDLVVKLKENHGKELLDIEPEQYVNDIFTALDEVPIPNDETIQEEADEILLGIEVDQWYSDLPLIESDDPEEHLKRRRLRDALVKKIHTLEKEGSLSNSNVEEELKHETSRFLNKMPIPQDESLNINFMVEELANRVKNRPKSLSPKQVRSSGKFVAFDESVAYEEFSRVMPCCSSFSELPGTRQAQVNETPQSMYMRDATRSSIDYSENLYGKKPPAPVQPHYQIPQYQVDPSFHESQQQGLTLHENGAPVNAIAAEVPAIRQEQASMRQATRIQYPYQVDPSFHESQQQWLTLDESGTPVNVIAAEVLPNQQASRTYHDNVSQKQFNQSGQYASQMPAQRSQEMIASIRQDQASMRQATCNQIPMEVQNIPQQVNQSVRLDQLGQQATCGSKLPYQDLFQRNPNQLPMHVQSFPHPTKGLIAQQVNQSIPLNLLVHQTTGRSQLPFQGQPQIPNQISMQDQNIPQQVNQSVKIDQPIQQASCGTQLTYQGPVQILEQIPCQSIASQTQQPCALIPKTPLPQASVAGLQTSRGILNTTQMPGPCAIPCNQIGPVNQNAPFSTNLNVPCNVPGTTQPQSAIGLPVGHSTPQNAIPRDILPRVIRKRTREHQRQRDRPRRLIDIEQPEDDDDNDVTDSDSDELCRCMERFRCRRRPMCSSFNNYSMNYPHFPMRCPYPYYF